MLVIVGCKLTVLICGFYGLFLIGNSEDFFKTIAETLVLTQRMT